MAGQLPPSPLLWGWVIEALANSKEVDVTTLIDVFNKSPKLSSNLESHAREMVSFRILERLFNPEARSMTSLLNAQNAGVSFDFSERCEDVLQHILGEMHGTKWDESEKSKWDVQTFIEHKRSCLLKSNLEQVKDPSLPFKDKLMRRKPSYLTSLKQLVASRRLKQHGTKIHGVNGVENDNQQQSPCIVDNVCQEEGNSINECFDDGKLEDERSTGIGTLDGVDDDEDFDHKEIKDIAVKRQVFFDSYCNDRATDGLWKVEKRCMKCKKGGSLLICSFDACPYVFHSSCLVSTSFVDDTTEKFYCPFCRYTRAILDYWEVKRKTSLARNDLASFYSSTVKQIPKTTHETLLVSEENGEREDKVSDEKNEAGTERDRDNVIRVVNTREVNTEGMEQAYPEDDDRVSHGEKGITRTNEDPVSHGEKRKTSLARNDLASNKTHKPLLVSEEDGKRDDKVSDEKNEASTERNRDNVIRVVNTRKVNTEGMEQAYPEDDDHVSRGEKGITRTNEDPVSVVSKQDLRRSGRVCRKRFKGQQTVIHSVDEIRTESKMAIGGLNSDLSSPSSENSGRKGCNEGSSEQVESMDRSVRSSKQINQSKSLRARKRRRTPVPWTPIEEETLRKRMAEYDCDSDTDIQDRVIPWREILKLGGSAFQKCRKSDDLRVKWRYIQRARSKVK